MCPFICRTHCHRAPWRANQGLTMLQEIKVVDSYISFVKNVKAGQPTQVQFRSQLCTTGSCNLLYTLVAGHRDLQRHKAVRQELLGWLRWSVCFTHPALILCSCGVQQCEALVAHIAARGCCCLRCETALQHTLPKTPVPVGLWPGSGKMQTTGISP